VITPHVEELGRLRAVLDEVAGALGTGSLDRLLAAEPELGLALEAVARLPVPPPQPELRVEIESVRAAVLRCRRLGAALGDVTRISLDPSGTRGYVRGGRTPAIERAGTLETRG
jgi:hypothetical protein